MSELFNINKGYKVSDKYVPISTQDVLNQFEGAGYTVNSVLKAKVLNPEKSGFQKHLIRMSHPDTDFQIDGLRPEIILKNSFDGSTSFNLKIGVFRFICSNGLEVGNSFQSERVRHIGKDVLERVLEATERIKLGFPELKDQILALKGTELDIRAQFQLVGSVADFLIKSKPNAVRGLFGDSQLLKPYRTEDTPQDAFTVLNRVQENALKGRYSYTSEYRTKEKPDIPKFKVLSGRKIKSIEKTTDLNSLIWDKALELIRY